MFKIEDEAALRALEESLYRDETRTNHSYLDHILAPDFFEIGRAGNLYERAECLELKALNDKVVLPFGDFRFHMIDAQNALLSYTAELGPEPYECTMRTSLWTRTVEGWQLRFHQGTIVP